MINRDVTKIKNTRTNLQKLNIYLSRVLIIMTSLPNLKLDGKKKKREKGDSKTII